MHCVWFSAWEAWRGGGLAWDGVLGMCGDVWGCWCDVAGSTGDTSKTFSQKPLGAALELLPHPLSGGYWDLGVWVFCFVFLTFNQPFALNYMWK